VVNVVGAAVTHDMRADDGLLAVVADVTEDLVVVLLTVVCVILLEETDGGEGGLALTTGEAIRVELTTLGSQSCRTGERLFAGEARLLRAACRGGGRLNSLIGNVKLLNSRVDRRNSINSTIAVTAFNTVEEVKRDPASRARVCLSQGPTTLVNRGNGECFPSLNAHFTGFSGIPIIRYNSLKR
jgi:hypothetical protein